jgi:hypothetical protein
MQLLARVVLGALFAAPVVVRADAAPPATNEAQLMEHGSYINKDGNLVHSPAHTKDGKQPAGASARCRDGSYSFSVHHPGTCAHHGGVSNWLR